MKLLLGILLAGILLVVEAQAQNQRFQDFTLYDNSVPPQILNAPANIFGLYQVIEVSAFGTFGGAGFSIQVTSDGSTYANANCYSLDGTMNFTAPGWLTTAGLYRCDVAGATYARALLTTGPPTSVKMMARASSIGSVTPYGSLQFGSLGGIEKPLSFVLYDTTISVPAAPVATVSGNQVMMVTATGSFNGATFTVKIANDNTNYGNAVCYSLNGTTTFQTDGWLSAVGVYRCNIDGATTARVLVASGTPGKIKISGQTSPIGWAKTLTVTPGGGTITGVTAGTGLNGGGSSGNVTINLDVPVTLAHGGTNQTAWTASRCVQVNAGGTALESAAAACGAGAGAVSSVTGTANQITASPTTGAVILSIPTNPTLPGTTTGTFSGNLTGNVTGTASGNEVPLTFTPPITRTVNTITCDTASGAQPGCLSAADWTTFNSKQPAGSYLTQAYQTVQDEGTPQTQRSVLNFAGAGVTCADDSGTKTTCTIPSGGGGTVTSVATTAPISGGTITTTGTITCDVASGSQPGCLSSADWTTFNNKQTAITLGDTQIAYATAANTIGGDSQATRDDVTHQTTFEYTSSVNVTAKFMLGTLTIPGPLAFPGALAVGVDASSGDQGFAGVADISAFGFSKEASLNGHAAATGATAVTITDQIAATPTIQSYVFTPGGLATAYSQTAIPTGVTFTVLGSGKTLALDSTTGTSITGQFNLPSLTASRCLRTDASNIVSSAGADCGTGTILGTIADTQVAFGSAANTITGHAGLIHTDTGGYALLSMTSTTGAILALGSAKTWTINVDNAAVTNPDFILRNETTSTIPLTIIGDTDNFTFWNNNEASHTWTFALSGATDPVLTFANNSVDVTTGNFSVQALTASRLVATDASKNLSSTITSANVAASVSDETGTAGKVVFDTDPTLTRPVISGTPAADGARGYDATQHAANVYSSLTASVGTLPRVMSVTRPAQTLTNSTVADQDYTAIYTIKASSLIAGKCYRVMLQYSFTSDGAASSFLHYLKLGSTVKIWTMTAAVTPGNNITNRGYGVTFLICGTAAAGASVNVDTALIGSGYPAAFTQNGTAQPVLVATNADMAITPGLAYGTNTNGESTELFDAVVEELN